MTEKEIWEASLKKNILDRIKDGYIKTYKPVRDDAVYRSWSEMEEYKNWCEKELPAFLGYKRISEEEWERIIK